MQILEAFGNDTSLSLPETGLFLLYSLLLWSTAGFGIFRGILQCCQWPYIEIDLSVGMVS